MKNYTLFFAALFAVLLTSCSKEHVEVDPTPITPTSDFTKSIIEEASTQSLGELPTKTISEFIQENEDLKFFYDALVHTELVKTLDAKNITVFAVHNDSMKELLAKGNYASIEDFPKYQLETILMSHISVSDAHYIESSKRGKRVPTLHPDQSIFMETTSGEIQLGTSKSKIYIANRQQTNGVVHQITTVLFGK